MFMYRSYIGSAIPETDRTQSWGGWFLKHGMQIVKGGTALLGLALLGGTGYFARGLFAGRRDSSDRHSNRSEFTATTEFSVATTADTNVTYSPAIRQLSNHVALGMQVIAGSSDGFDFTEFSIADGRVDFKDEASGVQCGTGTSLSTGSAISQLPTPCSLSLWVGASAVLATGNPLFLAVSLGCLPIARADFDCAAIRRKYDESVQYRYSCSPERIVGNQTEIIRVTEKYEADIKPVDNCEELGQADCTGLYDVMRNCGLSEEKALIFLMDRANRGVQRCENVFDAAVTSLYFTGITNQRTLSELSTFRSTTYVNESALDLRTTRSELTITDLQNSTRVLAGNFSSHLADYFNLYNEHENTKTRLTIVERELISARNVQKSAEDAQETAQWLVVAGVVLLIFNFLGLAEQVKNYLILMDPRNKLKLGVKRLQADFAKLFYELDNFHPATGSWFFRFKTKLHGMLLKIAFFCNAKLEFAERLGAKEYSERSLFFEQEKLFAWFKTEEKDQVAGSEDASKNPLLLFDIYKERLFRLYVRLNKAIYDPRNAHFDQILEIQDRYLRKIKNLREVAKYLREIMKQFHLLIQLQPQQEPLAVDLHIVVDKNRYQERREVVRYNIAFYEAQVVTLFAEDDKIPLTHQNKEITLATEIKEHTAALEKLNFELSALQDKHEHLQADHADLTKRHEQLAAEHHELKTAHEALVAVTQQGLKTADDKLAKTRERVKAAYAKLKTEHHELSGSVKSGLKAADTKLIETSDRLTTAHDKLAETTQRRLKAEIHEHAVALEKLSGEFSALQERHGRLQADHSDLTGRHEKLAAEYQKLETAHEKLLATTQQELKVADEKLVDAASKLQTAIDRVAEKEKATKATFDELVVRSQIATTSSSPAVLTPSVVVEVTAMIEVEKHLAALESKTNLLSEHYEQLQRDYGGLAEQYCAFAASYQELTASAGTTVKREEYALGLDDAAKKIDSLSGKYEQLQRDYHSLVEQSQEFASGYRELIANAGDATTKEKEHALGLESVTKKVDTLSARYKQLQAEYRSLAEQYRRLASGYTELMANSAGATAKTPEHELVLEGVSKTIASLNDKYEQLQADYHSLAAQRFELAPGDRELITNCKQFQIAYNKLKEAVILMAGAIVGKFEVADEKWEKITTELSELRAAKSSAGFFARDDSSRQLNFCSALENVKSLVQSSGPVISTEATGKKAEDLEDAKHTSSKGI